MLARFVRHSLAIACIARKKILGRGALAPCSCSLTSRNRMLSGAICAASHRT